MKGVVPKKDYPVWAIHKRKTGEGYLQGIFSGGCVAHGAGYKFWATAHAHCNKRSEFEGWICIRNEKNLDCVGLGLHELAHILVRGGHCRKWADRMTELYKDYFDREGL